MHESDRRVSLLDLVWNVQDLYLSIKFADCPSVVSLLLAMTSPLRSLDAQADVVTKICKIVALMVHLH